ncbi:LLM class flavin-dependent oxidoreductase [Novosphingobium flavum]|nr:LLM class flavin-dependent oxidoreductase [Novosphingobium flavum]
MTFDSTSHERAAMYGDNKLKIGLFGANLSSGRTPTTIPERWSGSWDDNLRLVRMADAAGLDFLLPLSRWKGYAGATNYQGNGLETFSWACGVLASTSRITVFATVLAQLFNPILASKMCATADQIGHGRFGLNVVTGWNDSEFDMFGISMKDHVDRYEYADEWLTIVKKAWSEDEFDYAGKIFDIKGARLAPKPAGGSRPLLMNAAASAVGQEFAIRQCDALFVQASRKSDEETAATVKTVKEAAAALGQATDVYTVGGITCRPSRSEAKEYFNYACYENADLEAIEELMASFKMTRASLGDAEFEIRRKQYCLGYSGLPMVGTPDEIAAQLARLSEIGLAGLGLSFINYSDELPYFCEEVLPRLERMGLRVPAHEAALA